MLIDRLKTILLPTQPNTAAPWLVVGWLVLTVLYGLTATWDLTPQTPDSLAAALPAWHLIEHGGLDLSGHTEFNTWLFATQEGVVSNRSPGLIGATAIGYALASPFVSGFVAWPATAVAVVSSSTAVALVAATAHRLTRDAWIPALVLVGLGTPLWGIASDQIWPHGPAALAVALAGLLLQKERLWWAGVALGGAILIRPPVAILAAVLGISLAVSRRDMRPLLAIGVPSGAGAFLLLLYGRLVFNSWSPLALYPRPGGIGSTMPATEWITNVVRAFVSLQHGVLIWSAWLLIGLLALRLIWSELPTWAKWSLPAGFIFLMVHMRLNRVSGGVPYSYRYPIEAVALVSPALLASMAKRLDSTRWRVAAIVAGATAVFLQGAFVFLAECSQTGPVNYVCRLF